MNKIIEKTVSLVLLILITLLTLDYFKIIIFNKTIGQCLSLCTVILIVFSATSVICTSKSGMNKFISYIILASISTGLIFTIINGNLNIIVYVSLILTVVYALMDMIYKKPN